jgi:hypothetical protein
MPILRAAREAVENSRKDLHPRGANPEPLGYSTPQIPRDETERNRRITHRLGFSSYTAGELNGGAETNGRYSL